MQVGIVFVMITRWMQCTPENRPLQEFLWNPAKLNVDLHDRWLTWVSACSECSKEARASRTRSWWATGKSSGKARRVCMMLQCASGMELWFHMVHPCEIFWSIERAAVTVRSSTAFHSPHVLKTHSKGKRKVSNQTTKPLKLSASVLPESCQIFTRSILHSASQGRFAGCGSTHCELPVQVVLVLWPSSQFVGKEGRIITSIIYYVAPGLPWNDWQTQKSSKFDSEFIAITPFSVRRSRMCQPAVKPLTNLHWNLAAVFEQWYGTNCE